MSPYPHDEIYHTGTANSSFLLWKFLMPCDNQYHTHRWPDGINGPTDFEIYDCEISCGYCGKQYETASLRTHVQNVHLRKDARLSNVTLSIPKTPRTSQHTKAMDMVQNPSHPRHSSDALMDLNTAQATLNNKHRMLFLKTDDYEKFQNLALKHLYQRNSDLLVTLSTLTKGSEDHTKFANVNVVSFLGEHGMPIWPDDRHSRGHLRTAAEGFEDTWPRLQYNKSKIRKEADPLPGPYCWEHSHLTTNEKNLLRNSGHGGELHEDKETIQSKMGQTMQGYFIALIDFLVASERKVEEPDESEEELRNMITGADKAL